MHRFTRLFALSCLLAAPIFTQAQNPDPAKVDAIFAAYDKADSPGCALGVIRDGKLVYSRGYGMANLEHNIPNGSKLIYDIGSTSKQFAAACIQLLAAEGKLTLEDEVRKFIPELPQYPQPVRIRHLVHHTSGLRDYLTLFSLAGVSFDDMTTEGDALKIILRQKALNFAPGEDWTYSNSGYFLLSIVIKRASGKSFAEYAKEKIFDPLGMTHTLVLDNHKRIVPMRATGYAPNPRSGFQTEMSKFEQTGDGAVQTSVEDLLLWDQNFYAPKVGGPDFLKRMHEVGAFNSGDKHDYASGLFIEKYKGLNKVSHGGSWAGYRSELLRFPDQRFSVACLCNTSAVNPSALALQVADLYLAAEMARPAAPTAAGQPEAAAIELSEAQMKELAGFYRNAANGEAARIQLRGGKLYVDRFGPAAPMTARAADRFTIGSSLGGGETEIRIERSANGTRRLRISPPNRPVQLMDSIEAFAPTPAQLADFAGSYYSEELDATYLLSLEGGTLQAVNRDERKRPLLPSYTDSFSMMGGAQLEFQRDAQGRPSGFALHAGRIRNVRFVRK
jgi:CubicO group peptidase (beta-lactamase class C family)